MKITGLKENFKWTVQNGLFAYALIMTLRLTESNGLNPTVAHKGHAWFFSVS